LAAQGLAAAQGLQGLVGFFTAAQGFGAQGLAGAQAAICTAVSAARLPASGSATAPADTVATLSATRVFFSMMLCLQSSSICRSFPQIEKLPAPARRHLARTAETGAQR
jgi:hypothetical protein